MLLFGLLAAACSPEEEEENLINGMKPVFTQSYIMEYRDGDFIVKQYEDVWFITFPSGQNDNTKYYCSPYKKTGEETWAKFEEIAWKNNDMSFFEYIPGVYSMTDCCADNFKAVHVTSNRNWDAEHPAGVLLDDILEVTAISFAPFVRSGYQHIVVDGRKYDFVQIQKPASELAEDDLCMLDVFPQQGFIGLRFYTAPKVYAEHTLTITLVTTDGRERVLIETGIPPLMD